MKNHKAKKNQRLSLEEVIKSLNQKIQNWEDTDPAFMDENLKSLRHKVMYVHMRLETSLEYLIMRDLMGWNRKKLDRKVNVRIASGIMAKMGVVFARMEFWNKVEACRKLELITGKFAALLLKVNDYRKHFSHPASHENKIWNYRAMTKHRDILKNLVKAFEIMDERIENIEKKPPTEDRFTSLIYEE